MKLLRSKGDTLLFQLEPKERDLLLAALSFFPLLNPDHHRLSKTADPNEIAADQKLLHDAMAEQRREDKKVLTDFLENMDWELKENRQTFRLRLTPEQIDFLLRILNDVRVGAWDILGRPNQEQKNELNLQSKNSHYYGVMELSGYFQMAFLHALEKRNEPS